MLSYHDISFRYEPYPIGVARNVLPWDLYEELLKNWPATELFDSWEYQGKKYALSEVKNPAQYYGFLRGNRPWRDFFRYVKSGAFVQRVLEMLRQQSVDMGLENRPIKTVHPFSPWTKKLRHFLGRLRPYRNSPHPLLARFEYSMLPSDGGCIKPHTDAAWKAITLVLSMVRPGEWDPSVGGSTDIMRPKDIKRNFNHINRQMEFEEMETIDTVPFHPNQCIVFVKTFNSFHAVAPMKGKGVVSVRKTLTINIGTK